MVQYWFSNDHPVSNKKPHRMSQPSAMKQIGARNMGCVIERMEWSNKMDLIAFGNDKGEIIIQRYNWQKIVTFPSPGEDVKVRSLSWQMDETVLAVGYSNGKVALLDAEREDIISGLDYKEDIKNVYFTKAIDATDYRDSYRNRTELTFEFFLPPLPLINAMGSSNKSINEHKSFAKGSPCFLIVSLASGKIHLLLLGALKAGSIDLTEHVTHPDEFDVYDVRLSGNFNAIYALVKDGTHLKLLYFHNNILQEYISPMLYLAVFCANILETKNYINDTIQCMMEAWETVLIEMDNKLTKYANAQPEGALSADFLELLVFGYATHEIEDFLMDDLTEKGLKKLANSVDLSFSTIQNLIAKPLQSAGINMFYFLNTTKGLSRIDYFYGPLISPESADEALCLCGAFQMKVLELQQIIDQCATDLKLFLSWLLVVIIRLHQQDVTEDIPQLSAEDTMYLSDYLNSFDDNIEENEDGTVKTRKFNLEKIGQYFETKDLQQMSETDAHQLWNKLLDENECLRKSKLIYPHEKKSSLLQQKNILIDAIEQVFQKPNESVRDGFVLQASIICCNLPSYEAIDEVLVRSSYCYNESTSCDIFVTTIGWQEMLVLEFDMDFNQLKCIRVHLNPGPFICDPGRTLENLRFVDLQFYNENTISLLLQHDGENNRPQSYFAQFCLDAWSSLSTQHHLPRDINLCDVSVSHSIHNILDINAFKCLDSVCTDLAVSGSRKVSTILSDSKRKMTIFEMEIDDDEEDTEASQASMLEISKESLTSAHEW